MAFVNLTEHSMPDWDATSEKARTFFSTRGEFFCFHIPRAFCIRIYGSVHRRRFDKSKSLQDDGRAEKHGHMTASRQSRSDHGMALEMEAFMTRQAWEFLISACYKLCDNKKKGRATGGYSQAKI